MNVTLKKCIEYSSSKVWDLTHFQKSTVAWVSVAFDNWTSKLSGDIVKTPSTMSSKPIRLFAILNLFLSFFGLMDSAHLAKAGVRPSLRIAAHYSAA